MRICALLVLLVLQEPDVDSLLKQLTDDSIEVREKAAAALVELGDKAEEKVKARMASAEGELQKRCQWILERIAIPKRLRGVLPPLKKVTIEAKEQNLKEVLEEVQRQTGISMILDGIAETPVTVQIKDATPLEALIAVCKSAGLGYFVDSHHGFGARAVAGAPGAGPARPARGMEPGESKVRFQPGGYVDVARLFVRHYAIEPYNVSLNRSTNFKAEQSSAQLSLRVAWMPDVKPDGARLDIKAVTDDQGRSLYVAGPGATAGGNAHQFGRMGLGNPGQSNHGIQLTYPQADARKIASVRGSVHMSYVMEEKTVVFEAPEKCIGQKKEFDGVTVDLQDFKVDGDSAFVKIMISGVRKGLGPAEAQASRTSFDHQRVRLRCEDGSPASYGGMSGQGDGVTYSMELRYRRVQSKIASVEVVMDTTYHTDSFDFELKDIPLPK